LTDLQSNVHCNAFDAPCSVKIINDQLYSPSSVVDNTIRQQKEKKINSLHSSTKKSQLTTIFTIQIVHTVIPWQKLVLSFH